MMPGSSHTDQQPRHRVDARADAEKQKHGAQGDAGDRRTQNNQSQAGSKNLACCAPVVHPGSVAAGAGAVKGAAA